MKMENEKIENNQELEQNVTTTTDLINLCELTTTLDKKNTDCHSQKNAVLKSLDVLKETVIVNSQTDSFNLKSLSDDHKNSIKESLVNLQKAFDSAM